MGKKKRKAGDVVGKCSDELLEKFVEISAIERTIYSLLRRKAKEELLCWNSLYKETGLSPKGKYQLNNENGEITLLDDEEVK